MYVFADHYRGYYYSITLNSMETGVNATNLAIVCTLFMCDSLCHILSRERNQVTLFHVGRERQPHGMSS